MIFYEHRRTRERVSALDLDPSGSGHVPVDWHRLHLWRVTAPAINRSVQVTATAAHKARIAAIPSLWEGLSPLDVPSLDVAAERLDELPQEV